MKRLNIFKILLVALVFVFPVITNAAEKVDVIIFTGDGCPHCAEAKSWFDSIESKYGDKFELDEYEIWYDEDNSKLFFEVSDYFDDEATGVPYIVIGKERFKGFAEEYKEDIIAAIENEYKKSSNDRFNVLDKVEDPFGSDFKFSDDDSDVITYGYDDDDDFLDEDDIMYRFEDIDWDNIFSDENFAIIGSILAGIFIVFIVFLTIGLVFRIIEIIAFWKVFKKANEPGWAALIPIYDTYVKAKIGGTAWWWILVIYITNIVGILGAPLSGGLSMLLPLVALFGKFNVNYNMSKKFHRDAGMAIVLTLFPIIGACVLGFGKSSYDAKVATSENGVFGGTTVTNNNNSTVVSANYCPNCGEKTKAGDAFCEKCGSKVN